MQSVVQQFVSLHKTLIIGLFCLMSTLFTEAQTINGPSNVGPNTTQTFTYSNGGFVLYPNWVVTNGTLLSSGMDLPTMTYYAIVEWPAKGSGSVTFRTRAKTIDQISVTIDTNLAPGTNLSDENYIYTVVPKVETTDVNLLSNDQMIETVTYFDGNGRTMQSIGIRGGNGSEDIVTHAAYDVYSRAAKEYLPYADFGNAGAYNANALNKTNTFYNTSKYENTTNPFSEKSFELSPLNRVLKQAAPGADWAMGNGNEIESHFKTNSLGEVKRYEVSLNPVTSNNVVTYEPTLSLNGSYHAGELFKSITKDENHSGTTKNHTVEEFTDAEGRVILKRIYADSDVNGDGAIGAGETEVPHDTYYVYDTYGNLSYVLPPKAEPDTALPSSTVLNKLCYQYKYDERNRLVEKKLPAKGWEYIVYNLLDLPVMTQDAIMRNNNQWLFTKYDAQGRVAYTGFKNSTATRLTFQNSVNNPSSTFNQYVTKTSSYITIQGTDVYYTNDAIPTGMDEILTINYYDDYNFDLDGGVSETAYNVTPITNVKGLATGSKVRVLNTNDWITSVSYYDSKGQPIYVYSKNNYLATTDKVKSKYAFDGTVIETTTTHDKTGHATLTTVDAFGYDHVNRLTSHTQNINGGSSDEQIVKNVYDELGQLEKKGVGGKTTQARLQIVDYAYNIRGWLKQINDVDNLGSDLFAFEINYNDAIEGNGGGASLFNGNISQVKWKTANDNEKRGYSFAYDALNRLTAAYSKVGSTLMTDDEYSIWTSYDKNGNLTGLKRNGHINTAATTFGTMDDLVYTYDSNSDSNQLKKVLDSGEEDFGFKDGIDANIEYTYDDNGNMLTDQNKGISLITYNHLNLPTDLYISSGTGGVIKYVYDATGVKLSKEVIEGGTPTSTTKYAGNYVYKDTGSGDALEFFNHPEGYVEPEASEWNYIYQYKDHLGNIRLSFQDISNTSTPNLQINEENNYYPFGLKHKGYNNVVNGQEYKYKTYQGQEIHEELGLNMIEFKWRFHDPAIARFWQIDPLAEDFVYNAPYAFSENSPIAFVELEGLEKVLAIYFHGGPTGGGKPTTVDKAGYTGQYYSNTQAAAQNNGREFSGTVIAPGVTSSSGVKTGMDFAKANYEDGDQVIVYGYSYGVDVAVDLTEQLKEAGIDVDLLVTIDGSDGPLQNVTVNTDIPDNVDTNLNIYQTDDSGGSSSSRSTGASSGSSSSSSGSNSSGSSNRSNSGSSNSPGSNGGPNKAVNPKKTNVINKNVTGKGVTHGNIQQKVKNTVQPLINTRIYNYQRNQ